MNLEKLLRIVGLKIFVKYYYDFKNCSRAYCINSFEENFTDESKFSRAKHAKTIMNNNLDKDALIIIAKSKRVGSATKEAAIQILESEFSCVL